MPTASRSMRCKSHEEVLPTVGTSRSNSRSQSRSRKISSLKTNCSSSKASLDSSSTTMRSRDIPTDSIAFAEDHKAAKEKRERTKSRSRMIGESPSPRSRNLSTYDMYRLSPEERVWANDKERKHGKFLEKVLSHKLSPSFLM